MDNTRSTETYTIKDIRNGSVSTTAGTGFFLAPEHASRVSPGDTIRMETVRFSLITGVALVTLDGDDWLFWKSDDDLEREHAQMMEGFVKEKRDGLAANREDWTAREVALPAWLRARFATFRERAGADVFDLEGWGYELCVAELAVLYLEHGVTDGPEVMAYAKAKGTSGNQHDIAIALARQRLRNPAYSAARTASALTPITGSPYYEKV